MATNSDKQKTAIIGKPQTYVLVADNNEIESDIYSKRGDCIVIAAKKGESLAQAVKKIEGPANIILTCHGNEDGTFDWHEDEAISYAELFKALPPKGIVSITIDGCYGGSAEGPNLLKTAPDGALVQALTGAKTVGWNCFTQQFARETKGMTDPVDLFLKALDTFDPDMFKKETEDSNKKDGSRDDTNPEHALPHMIGIGGHPPRVINLAAEVEKLADYNNGPGLDSLAWNTAITRVQKQFDTIECRDGHTPIGLGPKAEALLQAHIAFVADKIKHGEMPKNVEEKKIAYGLAAAYLQESGELERQIELAEHLVLPPIHTEATHNTIIVPKTPIVTGDKAQIR